MGEQKIISSVTQTFDRLERVSTLVVYAILLLAAGVMIVVPLRVGDWLTISFTGPYLVGLIFLAAGIEVFVFRRRDFTGKAFAVFAAAMAVVVAAYFDAITTQRLIQVWALSLSLTGGALVNLALVYPEENPWIHRWPFLSWAGYLLALLLYAFTAVLPSSSGWPLLFIQIFASLGMVFFLGMMFYLHYRSTSPVVQEQTRIILFGSLVAFGPLGLYFILGPLLHQVGYSPLWLIFTAVFPIAIGYTLMRYRLLQMDYVINQLALYSLLTLLAALGYSLLVSGLALILGSAFRANNPFLIGFIVFVLAFLFNPLRARIQDLVDKVFARSQVFYRERLQDYSHELTRSTKLQDIVNLLRQYIQDTLLPDKVHIYVYDTLTENYFAAADKNGKATSDLRFSSDNPLPQYLIKNHAPLFLADLRHLPDGLKSEQARLSLLGAVLYIPLPGLQKLAGWLALLPRQSGLSYSGHDVGYLESLADQTALAIERAQVVNDLERHVHEMNVLTRISRGINITLTFDDILELIYAQSNLLIPTRDFFISLFDEYSDMIYHAFYLENDERLNEHENIPIPYGQGMEREIIKTRHPIVTDDYGRECHTRGTLPAIRGVFSWIGVPLNTGAETIGVISLGSRDSSVIFTEEQAGLLQAIADQAAGAIVKTRLLQDAERRARQLTTLNEVARSMSSTLELAPLLNQITKSAVEILNCEAGSLLLVDTQTDELVFEVVIGGAGADLLGQRLPPGTGLVGKAVNTREAIIVNDVRRSKDWFEKTDQESGFTTNDLLVVPMIFQDKVTGVIEVLNRRDGLPFTPDDQEFLTAFTSQAAVALENARLYTSTDQVLASRVEELSVMQRIDRELNASLDVNRAMRITLEWAMRQSRVPAGLIGMTEEKGVRVIASQGYSNELEDFKDGLIPQDFPAITNAFKTGQPQFIQLSDSSNGRQAVLSGAASQVAIPIRRETDVIGVMMLENDQPVSYPDETLAFLSRLSDHAAIAIANARLYAEVQAANQAKSDFVSFVSHELKTPMTSIRGFADLLASGIVGPVNENQATFLSTIRSNVERMATLVSDLADVSRIEAGRLRLDVAAVPVAEIVEEVVRSTRAQIMEKQQELEVSIPDDLPAMWGDRMRLIQIVTNLVSNAYKYTPEAGHITVTAELSDQPLEQGTTQVIHLAVKDNGFGISPEDQKNIFQKFYRAEDQKVRDAPGTGLGLNITKQLVELQGGQIWFESKFRVGTTFHMTIPIAESA